VKQTKHLHQDIPSLFFFLKGRNHHNKEKDDEKHDKPKTIVLLKQSSDTFEEPIDCDEVLHCVQLQTKSPSLQLGSKSKSNSKNYNLSLILPDDVPTTSQNSSASTFPDLLSPDNGWWVSPRWNDDYGSSFVYQTTNNK